jgi:cytochrome c553
MKKYYLIVIGLFMFISGTSSAAGGDPIKGKALSQTCAACHSIDGNSVNPIWPKLAGQHASYIVKQLNDFKAGNRVNAQMTAMVASLSEQDMQDLGAYFASKKTKPGSAKPDLIELGQKIYRAGDSETGVPACMACHGPNGSGNPTALYPSLSGQHAQYTAGQLKMFKSEERANDANKMMRTIAGPMTNAQIEAVSEYIQGLH